MNKKSTSQSAPARRTLGEGGFFNPRVLVALVVCMTAVCTFVAGAAPAFLRPQGHVHGSQRTLSFEERVSYQKAIEDVYWRHRIWPKERKDAKPSLDAVMSQAQLEKKVTDYLRNSKALEDHWQRPITAEQLQAEMDRIAMHTRQPEVLRELFEALGNDPFVIAECLARPTLAERLLTNWYAYDQRIHGEQRQRAEAELQASRGRGIEQMKQLSGKYSEIEYVRTDSEREEANRRSEHGVNLISPEWDETVQRLAAAFGVRQHVAALKSADTSAHSESTVEDYEALPTEKLSSLQEDEDRYYATAVIETSKDHLKLATVAWPKEPLETWRAKAESQIGTTAQAASVNYTLPIVSEGGCIDDTWTATSTTNASSARALHTAVWTGTEMIVWGGVIGPFTYTNTGGKYNPSTDSWTATNTTNAPTGRFAHTAVWTGSEMIVWGGYDGVNSLNTGGKYNPGTDSWTATSTTNAPAARNSNTAVWTGSEMIVWGGGDTVYFNTGGRYNPSTDSWTATSTTDAPTGRVDHTAVWTGSEMIVWGGSAAFPTYFNTGGKYNPSTDSWIATSTTNAPVARSSHTAVWAGNEMIVWGGEDATNYLNTGGRYDSGADSWAATSIANAPTARYWHTAVGTGTEMIVWGGKGNLSSFNTGGRYDPSAETWTATSTTNAADARFSHTAVWTGSEMIVWGGVDIDGDNTGSRYCAQSGPTPTPSPTPTPTPCTGRCEPTPRPRPTPHVRPTPR